MSSIHKSPSGLVLHWRLIEALVEDGATVQFKKDVTLPANQTYSIKCDGDDTWVRWHEKTMRLAVGRPVTFFANSLNAAIVAAYQAKKVADRLRVKRS